MYVNTLKDKHHSYISPHHKTHLYKYSGMATEDFSSVVLTLPRYRLAFSLVDFCCQAVATTPIQLSPAAWVRWAERLIVADRVVFEVFRIFIRLPTPIQGVAWIELRPATFF